MLVSSELKLPTHLSSLAGGKAAFGGIRNGSRNMFDDDEEEDDDGRQRVELTEGSISLEQVSS